MAVVRGMFEIDLVPGEPELDGRVSRFTFTKTWSGELAGRSVGVMLSGGDPAAGAAGYVVLEAFDGTVDGRTGGFLFQQFGVMDEGGPRVRYEIVPGSGTGELAGIRGTLDLDLVSGDHRVTLDYSVSG